MALPSKVDTAVIGAGHCGLMMSWYLSQAGRDHVVLERRSTLGGGWQDRWDEFCLVSPNWCTSFPGYRYEGNDPNGYMLRDEIVARVAGYAAAIDAPVALETELEKLTPKATGGFELRTDQGTVEADSVVAAVGSFHAPRLPEIAEALPKRLAQLHSHHYRMQSELPDGAVLVVGSGQSGVQLAEELSDAGREVYLSVGTAGRAPRRYRGSDVFRWLAGLATAPPELGVVMPTVDKLPDPALRLAGNPHLSGHHGGHDTNLRQMAAAGMHLLGRIDGVEGERLLLRQDLGKNLAWADRFFDERFRELADRYIERAGIDAPPDDRIPFDFEPPEPQELDLSRAGITAVVWTTGYLREYPWLDLPIVDQYGFPRQNRGVTEVPGLYFLGLLWQTNLGSATLFGAAPDAAHIAGQLGLGVTPEIPTPPDAVA
jgi:putative flavoprotein involved in K+ transport